MSTMSLFRPSATAACATVAVLLSACGGGGGGYGDSGSGSGTAVLATASSVTVSNALYSQSALFTVSGANLDKGLNVTSAGCKAAPVLSTVAPNISTTTTAYFTCTVGSVGAQTASVARSSDGATLTSAAYTVAVPQVTLTTSNGAGVNGSIVITLEPAKAPITTDNFLAYVKSGFYVNTAYHRVLSGFVAQGGGYAAPITATATPALKSTSASIVLEDGVGLTNAKYTLAMARTGAPDSATSQFFINLFDNNVTALGRTNLDKVGTTRGYAVFGTVTTGTAIVDAMAVAPCTAAAYSECVPVPNIVITAASQTR